MRLPEIRQKGRRGENGSWGRRQKRPPEIRRLR
jgi:hypothetical protein